MNTKSIALIALLSALTLVFNLLFPLLMVFMFILISMTVKLREAIVLGAVIGVLSYLITGQILALTNVVLLPLIAIVLFRLETFIYGIPLNKGCHSNSISSRLKLGLVVFSIVLIANLLSESLAALMINGGIAYLIASFPVAFIGALFNAILIGLIGIYIQLRLQKIIQ
jgi:hypothetical protein